MTVRFEDVTVVGETDKALHCEWGGEKHWVPKSQIHDDSEVYDADENSEGVLVVTDWWAEKAGLV